MMQRDPEYQEPSQIDPALIKLIETAVRTGLSDATEVHDSLGKEGTKAVCTNAFGETALECDVRCENAVIEALQKTRISARLFTEEHGEISIGSGRDFTVTIDGLDGTRRYKDDPGRERYSTMISIMLGEDPTYDDYILGASKQHAKQILFIATRGQGGQRETASGISQLQTSGRTKLDSVFKAYIDAYFEVNREFYNPLVDQLNPECLLASCIYYEDLVSASADLVFECTRKGNLELASAYALVKEAGGAILLPDGTSLGQKLYRSFGQVRDGKDTHIPVLSAGSEQLAAETLARIRDSLPSNKWIELTAGLRIV